MRRPVKYKTRQAARSRLITTVTAAILGAGVIGGASAAVLLSRDDDGIDGLGTGTGSDTAAPVITDTVDGTDSAADSETLPTTDAVTETEPVTEAVTDAVTEPPETEPAETEPPVTEPTPSDSEPNAGQQTPVLEVSTTKNYRGGYLDLADYPTKAELKTAAAALRAEGYTAVMVELKYDNGKLSYKSEVAEAKEYGANPSVAAQALDDIVDVLHGEGLYVTGRVCALRDDLAAKGNSDAALMNTAGFRYSDGASRWISVYSDAGQDYILALLTEMKDAGVDEIMLRDYALPADHGTTSPKYDTSVAKTEAVGEFLGRVDTALSGAALNLELDAVTIADGGDEVMGIDCSKLGAVADSITADITLSNLRDGMTIGGKTIADVDADPAKTVETVLSALDASALNIRPLFELTGNAAQDAAQVAVAQNKGYGAYQMTERVISMTEK
ncbi:MAG: hypothetical protein IJW77_12335 [Clostridia bacterium]|nr:hypothetical protein [Clostridia bacterium]